MSRSVPNSRKSSAGQSGKSDRAVTRESAPIEKSHLFCARQGCSNFVHVHYFDGPHHNFRCPECLGLPISNTYRIPAGHYGKCKMCNCFFKCMQGYKGSKPTCPACRIKPPTCISCPVHDSTNNDDVELRVEHMFGGNPVFQCNDCYAMTCLRYC